jgi:hypothetical protein
MLPADEEKLGLKQNIKDMTTEYIKVVDAIKHKTEKNL